MTRSRTLHLKIGAWRQIRHAWKLKSSPALVWNSWVSGSLVSATDWLQTHAVARERAASDLRGSIFILGYWRSGTTFLHELLSLDRRFAFPTTYACMNPHHFILTRPVDDKAVMRPMDDMIVRNDSPQEDEFALLALGARSPYEALLAPAQLPRALALGDPQDLNPQEQSAWQTIFLEFLQGVSLSAGGRPLIVKSPAHGYRVATIRKLVPDAKFILLRRDPHIVFESAVRMWKTMTTAYGLDDGISEDRIRDAILADRPRYENKLAAGLAGLEPHRLAEVEYEDLVADPAAAIAAIYARLNLDGFDAVQPDIAADLHNRRAFAARNEQPSPEWKKKIDLAWADILARGRRPGPPI